MRLSSMRIVRDLSVLLGLAVSSIGAAVERPGWTTIVTVDRPNAEDARLEHCRE